MKFQSANKLIATAFVCVAILVIATSFKVSFHTPTPLSQAPVDTPKKKSVHIDIDTKDLDKALQDVNIELKKIDWNKISQEVNASINSIDVEKIKKDVTASLNNIDWNKIKTEVNNSVKNINFDEIENDIKKATDEIKVTINSEEFKNNMKNLQQVDREKLQKEIKKAQKEIEKNKDKIRKEIEKAKELLIYDQITLSEIANELEYSSVAHLSSQFKKVTGLTPSYFKKVGISMRRSLDNI